MEFVAPLEHGAMFGNKRKRPLLQPELGAFFYPDLRPLGRAAECGEHRDVRIEPHAVIAPMAGSDHPAVEVENPLKLFPVERRNRPPVPRMRKRRNDAQALFTLGLGWLRARNSATSRRSAAISSSSSVRRARPGSQSSPHGVP